VKFSQRAKTAMDAHKMESEMDDACFYFLETETSQDTGFTSFTLFSIPTCKNIGFTSYEASKEAILATRTLRESHSLKYQVRDFYFCCTVGCYSGAVEARQGY